jgi:peroxiredoxin
MYSFPDNLPVPVDDGACHHLHGMALPSFGLVSTDGVVVDLQHLGGWTVVYTYPRTGRPEEPDSPEWDAIPGARGCTPQSCGFRDTYNVFRRLRVGLFGLSTQTSAYQREAVERLRLSFPLLSDAELHFTQALGLPTFQFEPYPGQSPIHLRRMALILRDGIIENVVYPVFPPDRNAEEVAAWLLQQPGLTNQ